jgi:hypothetical protein
LWPTLKEGEIMQRRKLGTAVIWMVCLLGMVAVVWSRPPLSGPRNASHPPLALAAPAEDQPAPLVQDAALETQPAALPVAMNVAVPALPAAETHGSALPSLSLVRDMSPLQVSVKFEGQRVFVTVKGALDETATVEYRLAADYHLTTDSMLYGIITSAEVVLSDNDPEDRMEADAFAQRLFDQPFAIRYRLDAGMLTVKDFKMGPLGGEENTTEELKKLILGCYRPAPAPTVNP